MELCLPEGKGKAAAELSFLSPGSSSSLLSLLRDSEGCQIGVCDLVCTFLGFLSFSGEFLLVMWIGTA